MATSIRRVSGRSRYVGDRVPRTRGSQGSGRNRTRDLAMVHPSPAVARAREAQVGAHPSHHLAESGAASDPQRAPRRLHPVILGPSCLSGAPDWYRRCLQPNDHNCQSGGDPPSVAPGIRAAASSPDLDPRIPPRMAPLTADHSRVGTIAERAPKVGRETHRVAAGLGRLLLGRGASMAIQFVSVALIGRALGASAFGVLQLGIAIFVYVGFINDL